MRFLVITLMCLTPARSTPPATGAEERWTVKAHKEESWCGAATTETAKTIQLQQHLFTEMTLGDTKQVHCYHCRLFSWITALTMPDWIVLRSHFVLLELMHVLLPLCTPLINILHLTLSNGHWRSRFSATHLSNYCAFWVLRLCLDLQITFDAWPKLPRLKKTSRRHVFRLHGEAFRTLQVLVHFKAK